MVASRLIVVFWLIRITVQSAWINKHSVFYLTISVYCDQRAKHGSVYLPEFAVGVIDGTTEEEEAIKMVISR